MKGILLTAIILISGYCFSPESISQTAPVLNRASAYSVYTSVGEFSNVGTTRITGDIGNGIGDVTGSAVVLTGTRHFADADGRATAADVQTAYSFLANTESNPCGNTLNSTVNIPHTFSPGVHCSTAATSISNVITFDANNLPNAIFIIKINGALSLNTSFDIILTGGASLKNIYWQVNGAFNLAAGLEFKGTLLNNGAINMATGASLNGRALSTAGKVSLYNNNISNTEAALPVTLVKFTAKTAEHRSVLLNWTTTTETNSAHFEIERKNGDQGWNSIATTMAQGESKNTNNYFFTDHSPKNGNNLYRLKMVDMDDTFAYSSIRNIHVKSNSIISLYPNPAFSMLTIESNDFAKMDRIELNDISGKSVLTYLPTHVSNSASEFNIKHLPSGLYTVRITDTQGYTTTKKLIKN